MFKVIDSGANRLDIEMSGKLDAESMKLALDELVEKSKNIESGKMLYTIIDLQLPTIGAIGIEISRLPSMLRLMKKFNRAAVLTDKSWVKKISAIEGALFPGLEIRAFNIGQKQAAESWLSS